MRTESTKELTPVGMSVLVAFIARKSVLYQSSFYAYRKGEFALILFQHISQRWQPESIVDINLGFY